MTEQYVNPLSERYASKEMLRTFSADNKFSTWRKLWVALAVAQKELGLPVTEEQIAQMKAHIDDIDYEKAAQYERTFKHDVMAHVHTYGEAAPKAKAIIHLGATSAYVGDNADLIMYRQGLKLVYEKVLLLMERMKDFALQYADLPTLGYTHFQPAQLTTVGKRASLWLYDLVLDTEQIRFTLDSFRLLGVKGTTGTQASFMSLFENDEEKVLVLEKSVERQMGFEASFAVTGQTYPRKFDSRILYCLSDIAQSLHKCATDIRLLQHLKEIEEPFGKKQIGSSAMAYKRNPMKCERICSLARYILTSAMNPQLTASVQWFERTLDDSANRRICIPEAFLAADAILNLAINVFDGLIVNEKVIESHIRQELPFMLTENMIMESVKHGADRQEVHERIRVLSMEAAEQVKVYGKENDLLQRIAKDDLIKLDEAQLEKMTEPSLYVGRSGNQVREFINQEVLPLLKNLDKTTKIEQPKV
ncbi:MAG: adenylosuccinate lyase [Eubacteriaceae bacterium]|nr:adenylosuccinate lyase [Eubacteriaceae bacterium]